MAARDGCGILERIERHGRNRSCQELLILTAFRVMAADFLRNLHVLYLEWVQYMLFSHNNFSQMTSQGVFFQA